MLLFIQEEFMNLKEKVALTLLLTCLLVPSLDSQVRSIPSRAGLDKILVTGHSQYLGYLNAYLNLSKAGSPLIGQKVYLDTLLLSDHGSGLYTGGTPYAYDVHGGKTNVIKTVPKMMPLPATGKNRDIVLGRYALKNYIEWVYPQPESVIPVASLITRAVRFRWNYTGATLNTKVTLKNFDTNTEIFSTTLPAEQVDIPSRLFTSGTRYRFDLEVVGPMGQFKLTDATAPGSKIDFFYWAHMYFNVK